MPATGFQRESVAYIASVALLQVGYIIGAALGPSRYFGFNQLHHVGAVTAVLVLAAAWLVCRARSTRAPQPGGSLSGARRRAIPSLLLALLVACAGTAAFLLLRSHAPNPDGVALLEKIPRDVARYGAHVTHDEMLELYIHSRFYDHANRLLGWSVPTSYQVLSALAGGAFLFVLVLFAREAIRASQAEFLGLALAGGYVQLFFGDVENYTLVKMMILIYFALAHRYIQRRVPLWAPSLGLSFAVGLHLVAGWLLPSLCYLFLIAKRRGEARGIPAGAAALVFPIAALLVFLHFNGLPIRRLFDSSHVSGMGGHYGRYIAPLRVKYVGGIVNVVVLLLPSIVLLPALARFGQLGSDPFSRFLQIGAFSMLVFTFVWRAQLGVYEDWNLYAPGMVPVSLLVARSVSSVQAEPRMRLVARVLILTGTVHALMWILSNHYRWT